MLGDIRGGPFDKGSAPANTGDAHAKDNPRVLSPGASKNNDIELGSKAPESSAAVMTLGSSRHDKVRDGGNSSTGGAGRRDKHVRLRTPYPSAPEGGGGDSDMARREHRRGLLLKSVIIHHDNAVVADRVGGEHKSNNGNRMGGGVGGVSGNSSTGRNKPDPRNTGTEVVSGRSGDSGGDRHESGDRSGIEGGSAVGGGGRSSLNSVDRKEERNGNQSSNRTGGSRLRPPADTYEEAGVDDSSYSDIPSMAVVERHRKVTRASRDGGDSRRGLRRGGRTRSRRVGGSGSGSGLISGQEPALKGHGCMTTATIMKLITLLVALYNVAMLWARHYDASTGELCLFVDSNDCVTSAVPIALLTVSRFTAGALLPSIAWCILSKCYASKYFLHHSWLTLIIDFEPTHKLHTCFGALALLCSVIHSACHIARSAYQNNSGWLLQNKIPRAGLVAMLLLLLSGLPMIIGFVKEKLKYEIRKILHLLFIPFMVAICFHGETLRILGAVLLAWYLADRLYFTTRMTFFLSSPIYKSIGRGTLVRFELPAGYQFKPGAYVQVNCPVISASEWHPFSLFPVPGSSARAGFHVEAVGDWTDELFRLCLEKPTMPLWITAAQPSVVEQAVYYDNVVLVCTGAGITPAVSVAQRFSKKKNLHLLWLSRDAGMIATFEKQLRRLKSTVYLTGNTTVETRNRVIDLLAPSKDEVVASTTGVLRSSSRANSRSASYRSDLVTVEDGSGPGVSTSPARAASIADFRGVLRGEGEADGKTERAGEDGRCDFGESSMLGESVLGGSALGGGSSLGTSSTFLNGSSLDGKASTRGRGREERGGGGGGAGGGVGRKNHYRRRLLSTSQLQRARGLHPLAVNFGRPDIERFIKDTIEGTAVVAEWAPPADVRAPPPQLAPIADEVRVASGLPQCISTDSIMPNGSQMLMRLDTGQRISKRGLMEADRSVVDAKHPNLSFGPGVAGLELDGPGVAAQGHGDVPSVDKSTWLVLYCGANASVERAVANACDGLKVTWRKEYFGKW